MFECLLYFLPATKLLLCIWHNKSTLFEAHIYSAIKRVEIYLNVLYVLILSLQHTNKTCLEALLLHMSQQINVVWSAYWSVVDAQGSLFTPLKQVHEKIKYDIKPTSWFSNMYAFIKTIIFCTVKRVGIYSYISSVSVNFFVVPKLPQAFLFSL
jgi:hypothetical protein